MLLQVAEQTSVASAEIVPLATAGFSFNTGTNRTTAAHPKGHSATTLEPIRPTGRTVDLLTRWALQTTSLFLVGNVIRLQTTVGTAIVVVITVSRAHEKHHRANCSKQHE